MAEEPKPPAVAPDDEANDTGDNTPSTAAEELKAKMPGANRFDMSHQYDKGHVVGDGGRALVVVQIGPHSWQNYNAGEICGLDQDTAEFACRTPSVRGQPGSPPIARRLSKAAIEAMPKPKQSPPDQGKPEDVLAAALAKLGVFAGQQAGQNRR